MYTYLLVDLGALFIPIIASFHPRLKFYNTWAAFFPAMFLTALPFIIADIIFTRIGIWNFNPRYVMGIYLFSLPLEEYLFFFCIPYACVFTFYCFKILVKRNVEYSGIRVFSLLLCLILLIIGCIFYKRLYTATTFITLAVVMLFVRRFIPSFPLGRFFLTYLILIVPFFICNGILTGTGLAEPVVLYNNAENLGIRILTLPIEDIFYGMLLILLNIVIYESVLHKQKADYANH